MINEIFLNVLDVFRNEKSAFENDPIRPRRSSALSSYQSVVTQIPNLLRTEGNIQNNDYTIEGSISTGNISEIPWICVFDRDITTSAQNGYYIVYLFKADMSGVYISLNQGWTQYARLGNPEGRINIRQNAIKAQQLLRSVEGFSFNDINLVASANNDLARGYALGNICSKYYSKDNFPNDVEIINDLRNLIGVYRELRGLVGNSILDIQEVVSESEYQNIVQNGTRVEVPPGRAPERGPGRRVGGSWKRNGNFAFTALSDANFLCENDGNHNTFISAVSNEQYMEAHHLIPMEFQNEFELSIDLIENIICLCPNCHRAFHSSEINFRRNLISRFYNLRRDRLESRGIVISLETLNSYY